MRFASFGLFSSSSVDVFVDAGLSVGVGQGLAMDSIKFYPGPPCLTLLRPAGGPPLKRPYGRFKGFPLAGQAACARLLPIWTTHAVRHVS
jgi:hypothetical protein